MSTNQIQDSGVGSRMNNKQNKTNNNTDKFLFFYFFEPDKDWPWSYVFKRKIRDHVVLILKVDWW